MKMKNLLNEFPLLAVPENGKRLVYLDNGATTQRPFAVLNAVIVFAAFVARVVSQKDFRNA